MLIDGSMVYAVIAQCEVWTYIIYQNLLTFCIPESIFIIEEWIV